MRIVCVTPAGRRRYVSILAPYVLSDSTVQEWQVWLNTTDEDDLAWLTKLGEHPKVRLIPPPLERPDGGRTIGQFWRYCADTDAIYVRLDDDIVWLEPDFFARLITARQRHREAFLVSAMVINNALCSYVLQSAGLLQLNKYLTAECMSPLSWRSANIAQVMHEWLNGCITSGGLPKRFGDFPIAMNRFSINAICFFGSDIRPYIEKIGPEEEEFVSCVLPTLLRKVNMITSDAWCAHFAFYPQRAQLDGSGLLDAYRNLMMSRFPGVKLPT